MRKTTLLAVLVLCSFSSNLTNAQEIKIKLNQKDSFSNYVKSVSDQSKIKISVDRKSLAKHGITVNERVYMDPSLEYTLEEAMDTLILKLSHTNPGKVFWAKTVGGEIIVLGNP